MKTMHEKMLPANTQNNEYVITLFKVAIGVLALFASAQLVIPIKPVPITFQTVVISLIGLTYNPRISFITVFAYIAAGMLGLPMFSKFGSGLGHIMGASGGYILGLLIAAPIMGMIKSNFSAKFLGTMACCFIGHIIIYCLGIGWLSSFIGLKQAVYSGFIVYIPTGLLKIITFSYLFSYIGNRNR